MAALTNITQDHLDFHGTFEKYREAKALLFTTLHEGTKKGKTAVFNTDDYSAKTIMERTKTPIITYGRTAVNDVYPLTFEVAAKHMQFAEKTKSTVCYISRKRILGRGIFLEDGKFIIAWGGKRIVVCAVSDMKIFGSHNEENALGAIACAYFAGVAIDEIRNVLKTFQGVEHRLEYVMDCIWKDCCRRWRKYNCRGN